MDTSVIVLDSSDDEAKESKTKKTTKKLQRKVNSSAKSAKCIVGDRVLVSNRHISIEKSHTKSLAENRSKPPSIAKILTKFSKPAILVAKPSILPPFQERNADSSERDKSVRVPSGGGDGRDFRQKINTGEITIVPINNSALSPTSRPSTSPKNNTTAVTNSIEIRSITIKSTPSKSSSGVSSVSPPSSSTSSRSTVKRIAPLTVSSAVSKQAFNNDSDALSRDSFATNDDQATSDNGISDQQPSRKRPKIEKTPLNEAFMNLLDACRTADRTNDMEKLINRKLIRYYQGVHADFVNSKSFCKTVLAVAADIRSDPSLVYMKISDILEELNIRRKSCETVASDEEKVTSTGDARKDYQIRKLNRALYLLKKKIAKLDEAEVDWDDEHNSTFMILERYKKRAWEIFEKICDITGESKNAQRLVKKPIKFKGTKYPQFNRTLQTFVNDTQMFPDMFDVLRCLEHCNLQYNYGMSKDECKTIAQNAFLQIGEALQKRRKTDLYETASYFTGTLKDPALEDTELQTKLNHNQKYHDRIKELIEKFSSQQDPCESDVNIIGGATKKPLDVSDDQNLNVIDLDASFTTSNIDDDVNNSLDKSDRRTTTFDGCHNLNNNAKFHGTPMLAILSVTSLQPDDPLLENKDENKIIISDDEL